MFARFSDVTSLLQFGTLWLSWLRHSALSRGVADSIPGGVIGIFSFFLSALVLLHGRKFDGEELIFLPPFP